MRIVKHIAETQLKTLPDFKVGDVVKVHQRIKEGSKERVQIFEGLVDAVHRKIRVGRGTARRALTGCEISCTP